MEVGLQALSGIQLLLLKNESISVELITSMCYWVAREVHITEYLCGGWKVLIKRTLDKLTCDMILMLCEINKASMNGTCSYNINQTYTVHVN